MWGSDKRLEMKRIAVLISGNGSNLQAIIDAIAKGSLTDKAHIVQVISNKKDAYGLIRAQQVAIPTTVVTLKTFTEAGKSREDYDAYLAEFLIVNVQPDIVVLAGFMHVLSSAFLDRLKRIAIINLHPALPGEFDGTHAIERAYQAYQEGKITETGVMIHRVVAEVDRGEVIIVEKVPIMKEDGLEDLKHRIQLVEHRLIVEGILYVLYNKP